MFHSRKRRYGGGDFPFMQRRRQIVRLGNLELAGDAVERAAEVGADSAHNDDSGDSDQRGNEAILDGGCSALIIEAPLQNTKHRNLLTCGLKTRHPRFVFHK